MSVWLNLRRLIGADPDFREVTENGTEDKETEISKRNTKKKKDYAFLKMLLAAVISVGSLGVLQILGLCRKSNGLQNRIISASD